MWHMPEETYRERTLRAVTEHWLAVYLDSLRRMPVLFDLWMELVRQHPDLSSKLERLESLQRELAYLFGFQHSLERMERAGQTLDEAARECCESPDWRHNAAACAALATRRSRQTAGRNPAKSLYWGEVACNAAATLSMEEMETVLGGSAEKPTETIRDITKQRDGHLLIQVRALAAKANAQRVSGAPRTAAKLLEEADYTLLSGGLKPAVVLDDLYDLLSIRLSVLIDLGQFDNALEMVPRVLGMAATEEQRGCVSCQQGRLFAESGRPEEAVSAYKRGLELLPDSTHHRPAIAVSIANNLLDMDCPDEAKAWIRDVPAPRGSVLQFKIMTVRARLSATEGQPEEAEQLFVATFNGFMQHGAVALAALVLLDMAQECAQGSRAEILAASARLLKHTELEEPARFAIDLLRQHVQANTLTIGAVAALRNHLATGKDPAARRQSSSAPARS